MGIPSIEDTVKRMCAEIEMDIRAGRVPRTVASFSELHDHVDANEYGGFCDDTVADALFMEFTDATAFMNACQLAVDAKIKAGYFK